MNRLIFYLSALLPFFIFARESEAPRTAPTQFYPDYGNNEDVPAKTPAQIQQELEEDEALFKKAQEMFNPWYTGPLVTPGAGLMPPGYGNIQPSLVLTGIPAAFNKERRSVHLPHRLINFNPSIGVALGVTNYMDLNFSLQTQENWQKGESGGGIGDTQFSLGWAITKQTLWVPAIKFTIQETFPSGNYKNLDANGLNGSGGGSWKTRYGLAMSKLMYWTTKHPFNLRAFLGYTAALPVRVTGFNSYGGGIGTRGKVSPGNSFSADVGMELSLTQNFVLANDIVYTCTSSTKFSGTPGTTLTGEPASVGTGYQDNLSLAPAFEYNWSANLGIVAGVQFCVYGRNSANFISGTFSFTWTFGPI